jgi:hypothetical protein
LWKKDWKGINKIIVVFGMVSDIFPIFPINNAMGLWWFRKIYKELLCVHHNFAKYSNNSKPKWRRLHMGMATLSGWCPLHTTAHITHANARLLPLLQTLADSELQPSFQTPSLGLEGMVLYCWMRGSSNSRHWGIEGQTSA